MPKQQQMATAMTQLAINITQGLGAGFFIRVKEWRVLTLVLLLRNAWQWIKGVESLGLLFAVWFYWNNYSFTICTCRVCLNQIGSYDFHQRLDGFSVASQLWRNDLHEDLIPQERWVGCWCLTSSWQPEKCTWPVWDIQPKGGTAQWKP